MITLTEKAASYVKNKSDSGLRLSVKNSGCNGYKYDWAIYEAPQEGDVIVEAFGTKIVVDKMSYLYVQDATIDLSVSTFSSALTINNPMVKNTCGCGESISF